MTRQLHIQLPRLHTQQLKFRNSTAKRKVIVAGRRGGKTTGIVACAIEAALAGHRVLETAPVADQTNAFWDGCVRALAEPIAAGFIRKNESMRLLEFPSVPLVRGTIPSPVKLKEWGIDQLPTRPRIRCKTAHDAQSLRGDYADLLIFDEYSIMDPKAWTEVGAPMLLDNDGDAVFIFTPKRKNHAYARYVRAISDTTGRWEAFHYTSFDNPYLSEAALAEILEDVTEEDYKQEILAEFLDGEGAVFRKVKEAMDAPNPAKVEDHRGHRIILGGDWGQKVDYTAFSVGCADCRIEVDRDRFKVINYEVQKDRLRALFQKWHMDAMLLELNSIGLPLFQALENDPLGLPLIGFQTTQQSKNQMIQNLALVLERGEWKFQEDPVWTAELEAYEQTISKATGRSSYAAPAGVHDDTVIGRGLMTWQSRNLAGLIGVL